MRWEIWIKVFGRRAKDLSVGAQVYFRRGRLPQLGRIVGDGTEIRVPLMRCDEHGKVSTRRIYWRNRSQLYVKLQAGPAP
jgi:hypothetical protein